MAYWMMMYSLAVIHGMPCIPSLSSLVKSYAGTLLVLTHAAIQVVYINTFRGMFMVCEMLTPLVKARR